MLDDHESTAKFALLRIRYILRLSWALAWARFKLRIAGRYLGIFWYILEPLAFFLILLSLQINVGAASIPRYPEYLMLGLIMTNFFISTISGSIGSIRENKNMVQSISIPQEVLPLSTVIQFCFSHAIEFLFFIVIIIYYGMFSWVVLWYIPIFVVFATFVLGLSFLFATLGVFIEDLNNIWSVGSRLLWLGTPIFYALTPGTLLARANDFNPLYYFMTFARTTVVYSSVSETAFIFGVIILSVLTLIIGEAVFSKTKISFGEYL